MYLCTWTDHVAAAIRRGFYFVVQIDIKKKKLILRVSFQETKREADWFRIGFEPLFVDLSKSGCSYLVFLLVKVPL